jgi:hypothetical protein
MDPGLIELVIVDDRDGIHKIPLGSTWVDAKTAICMGGRDVAVDDTKSVSR